MTPTYPPPLPCCGRMWSHAYACPNRSAEILAAREPSSIVRHRHRYTHAGYLCVCGKTRP